MDTFAPESNGLKLQRPFEIEPRYNVVEDDYELGNVKSYAVAQRELRSFGVQYRAFTRAASEYWRSFFQRNVGPAARWLWTLPEYVPTPDAGPTLEAVVSGNQAERTIFVLFAWKNANGTTLGGAASSLLVPANNLIRVTVPIFPASVNQAVIYATQGAAGTEQEQVTMTNVRTWTQPNGDLLLATTDPPTTNTALEQAKCKLDKTYRMRRLIGTAYEFEARFLECY